MLTQHNTAHHKQILHNLCVVQQRGSGKKQNTAGEGKEEKIRETQINH